MARPSCSTLSSRSSPRTRSDDYVRLAARFGSNANALGVAVHRLRARQRELVRREVLQTVEDADALGRELESLRDALRG